MIGVKDGKFNRFMWDAEQPFPSEFQEIDSETWNKTFPDLNMEDFGHLKFYSYENTCTQHLISFFSGPCWLIYNVVNGAYSAAVNELIAMTSIVIGILRHDIKKKQCG